MWLVELKQLATFRNKCSVGIGVCGPAMADLLLVNLQMALNA